MPANTTTTANRSVAQIARRPQGQVAQDVTDEAGHAPFSTTAGSIFHSRARTDAMASAGLSEFK